MMDEIFKAFSEEKIPADYILTAMRNSIELGMFVDAIIPKPINEKEFGSELESANQKIKELKIKNPENDKTILMGILMNKLRGKISAKFAAEKTGFIQKELKHA